MTKKQVIKTVIYLLIVVCMIVFFCQLFKYPNDYATEKFETFRRLPKNSVDAVYIGSSAVDRYWNCAQAYEDYGMMVYPLSTDALPSWLVMDIIKEAYTYQNPELVIIDMRDFTSFTIDKAYDIQTARVSSVLRFYSPLKWDAASRCIKVYKTVYPERDVELLPIYLSFIKYHNRWEEDGFTFYEVKNPQSDFLGFYMSNINSIKGLSDKDAEAFYEWSPDVGYADLDVMQEDILMEIINYSRQKGFKLLFVDGPHSTTELKAQRNNTLMQILDRENIDHKVITSRDMGEYPLDIKNDFYNGGHVNYFGATKYTNVLSAYLNEKYDFPDHRNDQDISAFDGVLGKITSRIEKLENK